MYDIIFLSYDEPNADKNFLSLKARFPHVRRVHGIKGIANAHIEAAKKALTQFFYVVDADTSVHDDFDFTYKIKPGEEQFVHVWYAMNPALGVPYGYGGIKLFNKSFFKDVKTQVDFTTTLTKDIKILSDVVCTTNFNSDPYLAFRGAFRESAKLYKTSVDLTKPRYMREEAMERLEKWLNPVSCRFRRFVKMGAEAGLEESKSKEDISFINDHDLISSLLDNPEIDKNRLPTIPKTDPMKPEFFFINRIASAFYDEYVLENLPITEIRDAMSDGQMLSKRWLINAVEEIIENGFLPADARTAILGGWIGTLSLMMNSYDMKLKVTSIDMDERVNIIAQKLNYDFPSFRILTNDMYMLDYNDYDLIINTSSEHIEDIAKWKAEIPPGKIVVVQNNNFNAGNGHVSCVSNSAELRDMLAFEECLYEGTKVFPQYERYMVIGRT